MVSNVFNVGGPLDRHAGVVLLDGPPVLCRLEDDESVVEKQVGQLKCQTINALCRTVISKLLFIRGKTG